MPADGDRANALWPDDHPDPDWPDDWPEPDSPNQSGQPAATRVPRRVLALALTAAIALGAGAGAVFIYKNVLASSTPAGAAPGPSTQAPGAGGGAPGGGAVTSMVLLARVVAVGSGAITLAGPGPAVSARVTGATQFTGSAQSLAQVHVGDIVAVEVTVSGGVATVVRLQDPASQP